MFAKRILRAFGNATTAEEQASRLRDNLTNSYFLPVRDDLAVIILEIIPDAVVYTFGSATTELADVDSDLDIFVKVPQEEYSFYLSSIFAALQKSPLFRKIVHVSKAKIPIVKCEHVETGVSCDLNLKTELGVHNSELLKVLLHSDDRIYLLATIIKFWAKAHGLSGQGRFSNYALMMLLVFYLQQRPDAVLPSIASLQQNCPPKLISGWNVAFSSYFPKTKNTESLLELLQGFFQFCSEFDFAFRVICPLTGESFSRADTACRKLKSLRLKPITIQDPFELTDNIAACVSAKLLIAFQKLCAEMKQMCESTAVGLGRNNLLGKLFVPVSPGKGKSVSTTTVTLFPGRFADYALIQRIVPTSGNGIPIQYDWYSEVRSFVELYIKKVMLFEIESWKTHPQYNSKPLSYEYYYVSHHIFYDYRKKVRNLLKNPCSTTFIDSEILVSEYIKKNYKFHSTPIMKITLVVRVCTKPCRLELVITNNGTAPDKYGQLVKEFLRLQKYYHRYLNDLIKKRRKSRRYKHSKQ